MLGTIAVKIAARIKAGIILGVTGAFIVAAAALLGLTLAGYLGEFDRTLELTAHFKVQYLLLSLIPLCFFLLNHRRLNSRRLNPYVIGLSLSVLCLLINLAEIARYLPQPAASGATGQPLRVLVSNIDKYSAQYPQVAAMVREVDPDIAVLVEVGKAGAEQLAELLDRFPHSVTHQDVEIDGTAIYSKLPLLKPEVRSLGGGRKAVLAQVMLQDKLIALIAVHPSNAIGKEYVEERNRQLAAIADYVNQLSSDPAKPSILLAGDFNTTMWSPYYRRSIGSTPLHNSRLGFCILPTWTIFHPFFAIPIDHCLVSPDLQVTAAHTGQSIGSDHLPLITELVRLIR